MLGGGAYFFMRAPSPASEVPSEEPVVQEESPEGAVMAKNSVEIKDFSYSPQTITVKVGDSVTWTNKDVAGHSATADDGSFDTGVLAQGESGVVTFDTAGTFAYHCTPHPNITGTAIVEP